MEHIKIKLKQISDHFRDIPLPAYSTEGSAGMDIRAAIDEDVIVDPASVVLVPTNLIVEIPEGFELQVRPRSGLAVKHSIGILNSPGTIDSDYRGEVKIILMNFGKEQFIIRRGDRIAQLVLSKVYKAVPEIHNELKETARGAGGFGHSGKK
jgi:dUTP pyrophosphatase